jgi:LuxR family maltose regulon positive regulatory protein
LLSQWIQSLANEHISATWVYLDASDNEPLRFWNVIFTALVQKIPVFSSLQLQVQGVESIATLLTLIINTSVVHAEPIVLMLDDYHTITDSAIQEQMTYLIEHLPPHMHIVLSTRQDPYLPLARLRLRDQILEVHMDALRFTYEEATIFLNEVMHLSLTDAEISYLVNHVDGWIAGLRLAGCAMYKPHAVESVSAAACGSQRYIFGYILEEVLSLQEEHVQTFLLRTAFLSHFSPSLCDAVLDQQDSWQILQQVECANLFLIPEDHEQQWYHYETLFAEALRCRLERTEGEIVPVLHRRASHWYEQHGFLADAIEHLCEAHDWENAAILIERIIEQQSTEATKVPSLGRLQNLLAHLPEALVQLRPRLRDHNILNPQEQNILTLSPPQQKEPQTQQPPPSPHLLNSLSPREIEVLRLIAQGESNVGIANNLVIALATVKSHVSNILSKLQATNRTQAVACARRYGLLQ